MLLFDVLDISPESGVDVRKMEASSPVLYSKIVAGRIRERAGWRSQKTNKFNHLDLNLHESGSGCRLCHYVLSLVMTYLSVWMKAWRPRQRSRKRFCGGGAGGGVIYSRPEPRAGKEFEYTAGKGAGPPNSARDSAPMLGKWGKTMGFLKTRRHFPRGMAES